MQSSGIDWDTCCDPEELIDSLNARGNVPAVQFRQFSLACCRRVQELLPNKTFRDAILKVERFAADRLSEEDRLAVHEGIWTALKALPGFDSFNLGEMEDSSYSAALVVLFAIWIDTRRNHGNADGALYVVSHTVKALAGSRGISQADNPQRWEEESLVEKRALAELVREMFERPAETC